MHTLFPGFLDRAARQRGWPSQRGASAQPGARRARPTQAPAGSRAASRAPTSSPSEQSALRAGRRALGPWGGGLTPAY